MADDEPTSPANIRNTKFCKTCGVELSLENARETRKRSGSLRSKCSSCEREEDRARHKAKYVKKHRKLISRGTWFVERPNRIGMAAQCAKAVPVEGKSINHEIGNMETTLVNNKHIMIFYDDLCDECGGIRRYEEHLERVCEKCGLLGDQVLYGNPISELASRQLKSYEKSRYHRLRIVVNRDKEVDIQHSLDCPVYPYPSLIYEPVGMGTGTFDPTYAAWYRTRLE